MKLRPIDVQHLNTKASSLKAVLTTIEPFATSAFALVVSAVLPLAIPFTITFVATRYRQINNLIHWASHRSLCNSKSVNDTLGKFLCAAIFCDFSEYRKEHYSHHLHVGDYVNDGDFSKLKDFKIHESIGATSRIGNIFRIRRLLEAYAPKLGFRTKSQGIGTLSYLAIILLLIAFGLFHVAFSLLFSTFFLYPLIRHLTDLVDHGGIYEEATNNSRNFIINDSFSRWLFFPSNDCFHEIHHRFPAISHGSQEAVHKYLMQNEASYADRTHYWYQHLDNALSKQVFTNLLTKRHEN